MRRERRRGRRVRTAGLDALTHGRKDLLGGWRLWCGGAGRLRPRWRWRREHPSGRLRFIRRKRARRCGLLGGRRRSLQRLDRLIKREAMGPQDMRRRAAAFPDDRSEHDGPVDLSPPALMGGRGCVFQDAHKLGRGHRRRDLDAWNAVLDSADECRRLGGQAGKIDIAGLQDRAGILILAERQQQMLEHDGAMGLVTSIVVSARQRCSQHMRHRYPAERLRKRL